MLIIYDNKKLELIECKSFFQRFKGFMFCKKINKALLFNHCNSIHTFFMKKNIDVILCDKDNIIKYYYANYGKNKIILPKKDVYKVIETPANYFNIKINTKIVIKKTE